MKYTHEDIRRLAQSHDIGAQPLPLEVFANAITRLADDEPDIDDTERMLLSLRQAGHIDDTTLMRSCHTWQREKHGTQTPTRAFDPFGDFQHVGYLRNVCQEKNQDVVKAMEHLVFVCGLPQLMDWIQGQRTLDYDVLRETHHRIFKLFYPWAGEDRQTLLPDRAVRKGHIYFANPDEIEHIFKFSMNQNTAGKILGGLALAHPFLDGNGRALAVFFSEHQRRQGRSVHWNSIPKQEYLTALGDAIEGDYRNLDRVLKTHTNKIKKTHLGA